MQPTANNQEWFDNEPFTTEKESSQKIRDYLAHEARKPMEENVDRERNRAWYSNPTRKAECPKCGYSILSEVRLWFNYGFNDGARWSLRYSSKLSPHIAKFIELLTWSMLEDDSLVKTLKRVVLGEIVP